jgi:hypothetical protein
MSICDTCGHRFSDVCGGCESLDGVPMRYSKKHEKTANEYAEEILMKIVEKLDHDIVYGSNKKKTNADRIRAMTGEELADWLCHIVSNETVNCSHCIAEEYCKMGRNGFKEWLKQEVKE